MKKLGLVVLILFPIVVEAQNSFFSTYSRGKDLIFSDTFLVAKHRLYPTGLEWAEGKQYIQEGSRWVDIDASSMEVVSTSAGSQGLVDHWEIHKINWDKNKNRVIFRIKYLTVRAPYEYRAGKLGMIILEYNPEMKIETMSFNIADEGYSGMGETFYIYRFDQKVPVQEY